MANNICVIGGGAAGMFAAVAAAECGAKVSITEHNEKLGKKLFITGKGRCNFTNGCDTTGLFDNIVTNSKFLYSAIYGYDNYMVRDYFESRGLKVKVERGERMFPASDKSSDVIKVLENDIKKLGIDVFLKKNAEDILPEDDGSLRVSFSDGTKEKYDRVILCSGGVSYPSTGSDGSGLKIAEKLGHKIVNPIPSLVGLTCREEDVKSLQGLSLKNISITLMQKNKKLDNIFGEMLFTHYGVSGPVILTASAKYGRRLEKEEIKGYIDLKPALSKEKLDERVLRDFKENANRDFVNAIGGLFPSKLIPVIVKRSGIDEHKKVHDITKEERERFVNIIKAFEITIDGFRNFDEAIITKGGVSVKDIDPSTMQSKLVSGLYFAGEIIDTDALTGGFNLQIAWSTGHLAGICAAE
ncbi:MAG: NAD(P)/FAD-dependent oxidoreductase [Eubacterium sp.]|nr:NAD(P)/FAD-dependent oxidoreductase [Eubacterium sp.]